MKQAAQPTCYSLEGNVSQPVFLQAAHDSGDPAAMGNYRLNGIRHVFCAPTILLCLLAPECSWQAPCGAVKRLPGCCQLLARLW